MSMVSCMTLVSPKVGMAACMAADSCPISGRGSRKKLDCIRTLL